MKLFVVFLLACICLLANAEEKAIENVEEVAATNVVTPPAGYHALPPQYNSPNYPGGSPTGEAYRPAWQKHQHFTYPNQNRAPKKYTESTKKPNFAGHPPEEPLAPQRPEGPQAPIAPQAPTLLPPARKQGYQTYPKAPFQRPPPFRTYANNLERGKVLSAHLQQCRKDGFCNPNRGENCQNCPEDCFTFFDCCGDGFCGAGEDCTNCPRDCCCGNGRCDQEWGETCISCLQDCGTANLCCGDGVCDQSSGEDCMNCPSDCCCGDGLCEHHKGETCITCPDDCKACNLQSLD